ncbi:ABC transporter substrate-binding protein [Weissella sagaensis]|uniref:ABC transporter substrate-binding protein n=1 Tax=Weissella sagaensis TaxID=2559928 RepID=UPI00123B819C|nr:ABC transporter substrate-binding protein [Weissella sagaensis]KAA8435075.1 ABC transporter substrate-binding protein [Weissella paramesenteroides]KAA8438966.1 ABC transporter substrate-binding protein [Weissella paramesenteroides]MBU7568622.1 ABC transporter substrate-binding protein [Weissella hellenica]
MKKIIWLTTIILGATLALFGVNIFLEHTENVGTKNNGRQELTIYNWGDYIDPDLLKKFQKETGYKVDYETFDSNEAMFTKIQQGGTHYDLAVPSDYMIQKMKAANLLLPLDHKKLTGLGNYDKKFMNQAFDKGNKYSVPYFWGTLGIVYNDKYIKPGEIKTWNDLWQPKYKKSIMLIDSSRDIMGMALASSGQSVNTKSIPELAAAKGKLDTLMPNVKAIVADEIKTYMAQEEATLAVDYSGDAAEMISENKHLHYVVPSDGGNLWFDNIVMPKTVKNKKAAYAFLNFMSKPANAKQNAIYVGYATPNKKAVQQLPKAIKNNPSWYPDNKTLSKLEVYEDLGPNWVGKYNDYFLEFKMTNR